MIPRALDAVLVSSLCSLTGLHRSDAERMADVLRDERADAEIPSDLRAQLMSQCRTRLACRASKAEARKSDRNGGFKSVYFDGCDVIAISRPQRYAQMRACLIEFLVQHAMYRQGHNVPQLCSALVRVVSTPVIGMYQVVAHSERMTCTLAEYLVSAAYAGAPDEARTRACVVMLSCVCYGLHKINGEMCIRHGDLKPDNVMLRGRQEEASKTDGDGVLRRWCLIDFGLMRECRSSCGDVFFLCWWLAHCYAKHLPAKVLSIVRRALTVPVGALRDAPHAASYVANDRGVVDFAKTVMRDAPAAVAAEADVQWRRLYGITKSELYGVQRALVAPALEPAVFVKRVHVLFRP